jgi:Arylsulfotransferase (ASST)
MRVNVAKSTFVFSALLTAFAFGFLSAHFRFFPYQVLRDARQAAIDLRNNWKSYGKIEPSRWLAPSRSPGAGVTRLDRGRAQDGLTLVSSLFDHDVAIRVMDLDGRSVRNWKIRFNDIWSEEERARLDTRPLQNWDVGIMGAALLPDASIVFTFNNGGLVRMDRCGRLIWKRAYLTHHSVTVADDGSLWIPGVAKTYKAGEKTFSPLIAGPFIEDSVLQLDQSGRILREVSVAQLLLRNGLEGVLLANGVTATTNATDDYTHLNKIDVLSRRLAPRFPMFSTGDVLISLRNLNLLVVFSPESLKVKWHRTGPWLRQHDAEFTADGLISVFDNRSDNADGRVLGGSRIVTVDPGTGVVATVYAGSSAEPFYSGIEGEHVYVENGNILISEAEAGRLFEVDRKGQIVWEFINRYDDRRVVAETHGYARISRQTASLLEAACPRRIVSEIALR